MGRSIKSLKGTKRPYIDTAYVIGSGASMEGFRRYQGWFEHRLTITVNETFRDWRPTYALMHHHDRAQEAINDGHIVVTSEHDCGMHDRPRADFTGPYYTYRTANNTMEPTLNLGALRREADDELIISACTTAEAMHFAYFLGAEAIILCGVDGGSVDGKFNYEGYNGGGEWPGIGGGLDGGTNPDHLRSTRWILLTVAEELRKRGVMVGTLTPWVGLDMEGHKFQSMETRLE